MDCEKVKILYPNQNYEPCCVSCHEDVVMGYGGDLWIQIIDEWFQVCCAIMRAFERK